MYKSETIGKLAEALSKAQGMMKGAIKDSQNPFFKQSYADLSSVWEACREPLSKNGLSVTQTTRTGDGGEPVIITTLLHLSGEWVSGELQMKPVRTDPQSVGSAITYGRRYALSAIVGIAPEDDDGETAQGRSKEPLPPKETEVPAKTNYDFLQAMKKIKQSIGDEAYYNILGAGGYKHSNEVKDRDVQITLYKVMKKYKAIQNEQKPAEVEEESL
jgi:hypothetical protein